MTRVDFYVAPGSDQREWLNVACRLVEKAWRKEHSVYVHTADQRAMQTFDELLWSFRPNSFVPHRAEDSDHAGAGPKESDEPEVLVACSGQPGAHHDVLVNLTHSTPEFFSRFTRIAEIVRGDEPSKQRSRERYKYYRERGFPLHVHDL